MSNIFESDCQAIINTINCVGVMGGGLALQFKRRYPAMNETYERICERGEMRTGRTWPYHVGAENRWVINFPTKKHWKDPSEIGYITEGLASLRMTIAELGLDSIAVPPLGCGLGGLDWAEVEPLIKDALGGLGIRVDVYPPNGDKYTL